MNKCEIVMWEDVKRDMDYPEEDNNEGLIFGVNWLDEDGDNIEEVNWYKTEEERAEEIKKYNYKIIN